MKNNSLSLLQLSIWFGG